MSRRARFSVIGGWLCLLAMVALVGSGCEQNCTSLQQSYDRALAAEQTSLDQEELTGDSPAQFGLALHTSLLGDILDLVMRPALDAALTLASTVQVNGESVSVRTSGDLVDFDVSADPACDHCFRVESTFDGTVIADIPSYGRESAHLGGSFAIVAPLLLERGETADAALKFDLPAMVEVGRSTLSAKLGGVSTDVADMLEGPLSRLLLDELARQLDPITIVEFDAPSFGIPGLKVAPVELVTDAQSNTVFAGFATNIDALDTPGAAAVAPITDLRADENFALAFQPAIVSHALSLLMNDGQVARTYDLSGNADEQGSAHVTLDGFRFGDNALSAADEPYASEPDAGSSVDAGADAGAPWTGEAPDVPFSLGFEVFNLDGGDQLCFGFGAQAIGGVSVRQGALSIELLTVRFTDSFLQDNLVDASNWLSADFVQQSRTIVSDSLDQGTINVPGTQLGLGGLGLETRPNAIVLRAAASASAP